MFRIVSLRFAHLYFSGFGVVSGGKPYNGFKILICVLKYGFVFQHFLFVFSGLRVLEFQISPSDGLEAHVQHLVGLIQHQEPRTIQRDLALRQEVF